jgi:hypothetical protein
VTVKGGLAGELYVAERTLADLSELLIAAADSAALDDMVDDVVMGELWEMPYTMYFWAFVMSLWAFQVPRIGAGG